jgi:hypothetical protein
MREDLRVTKTVRSYLRPEVHKSLEREGSKLPDPVLEEGGISVGDVVYVSWMTGGYLRLTVENALPSGLQGRAESVVVPLAFTQVGNEPPRWRATGFLTE